MCAVVKQHRNSDESKSRAFVFSSLLDKFRVNAKDEDVVGSEIAQIYHAAKHNSRDCTLKINTKLHQDSKIEAKLSLGRTKSEAFLYKCSWQKKL